MTPNSAKKTRPMETLAAEKRAFRKKRSGSMGCSVRSSQATKAARAAVANANPLRTPADVHPWPGASMIDHTSAVRPTTDRTAPTGSSRRRIGSRDSGTSTRPATIAATTIGTFTRNTEPHQKCFRRSPPATGPKATPRPDTPAHAAIAFARSFPEKTLLRIDSVDGMIAAAPRPISARLAIRSSADPLNAARTDPAPKTTRPTRSVRRRPKRSPRLPTTSSRPANTSMYESTIHCIWLADGSRSCWSVGIATLRIVLSRLIRKRLRLRTPSVHQRNRCVFSADMSMHHLSIRYRLVFDVAATVHSGAAKRNRLVSKSSRGTTPRGGRRYDRARPVQRDYSKTPLSRKLGAKPGVEVLVLFTTTRAELESRFEALKATLAPADGLWIAWPKKTARVETDLDFDAVQQTGLAAGLVDNKSAAIDDQWQALRFVYRRSDR